MLECSPLYTFGERKDPEPSEQPQKGEESEDEDSTASLFVKNLSFSTTDEGLTKAFEKLRGFRKAIVMKKKSGDAQSLSMGYGFVEFKTLAHAEEAMKKKQSVMLDGHTLTLARSEKRLSEKKQSKTESKKSMKLSSAKLAIRNVPFEATPRELRQLFEAYGKIVSCRIPKKAGANHRGFAFIEYMTKAEAGLAMESLQHTHLYGRRLVIEPAEEQSTTAEEVRKLAAKREAAGQNTEAKKRRRANLLAGGNCPFKEE